MIEIIGAPFDLGGRRRGSGLGPYAVQLEGLSEKLHRIGVEASDHEDFLNYCPNGPCGGKTTCEASREALAMVKQKVSAALTRGSTPVVLGGDHSVSVGSISAAQDRYGDDLGVLWVDAHMDLNTPETSPSGNMHGMAVAALIGMKSHGDGPMEQGWQLIDQDIVGKNKVNPGRVAWIGLRDVDAGEVKNAEHCDGCLTTTMQDIDGRGLEAVISQVVAHLKKNGAKALWVSFDVDSLDPVYAPGTGTAVRGGLTYREGQYLAERLYEITQSPAAELRLAGVDVVEVNPLVDTNNETARTAVEWILSLFGKTILHRLDPGRTER